MARVSYLCQKEIIKNLPYFKRQQLARVDLGACRLDKTVAYSFTFVELHVVPERFIIQVDDVRMVMIRNVQDDSTTISYQKMFILNGNFRVIPGQNYEEHVKVVPGLSAKEAFDKWIESNINREGTCIMRLSQIDGYPIPNCKIYFVESYIVNMANVPATPLLPERMNVRRVQVDHQAAFTNSTIRTAPVVECDWETRWTAEELINLNCIKLTVTNDFGRTRPLIEYCRKLQERGRPVGFWCYVWFNIGPITPWDRLKSALEGRSARMNLKRAFTLDIDGMPEAEMIFTVHHTRSGEYLRIEVAPSGTAVPSRERLQ